MNTTHFVDLDTLAKVSSLRDGGLDKEYLMMSHLVWHVKELPLPPREGVSLPVY